MNSTYKNTSTTSKAISTGMVSPIEIFDASDIKKKIRKRHQHLLEDIPKP